MDGYKKSHGIQKLCLVCRFTMIVSFSKGYHAIDHYGDVNHAQSHNYDLEF